MKNNSLYIILLFLFFGCKKENLGDCFKSTGKMEINNRSISSFSEIELSDQINLHVTYSNELSLQVRAGKNLQKLIETKIIGNKLIIENKNKCNWVRSFKKKIDVFLLTPKLNRITYYGSGEINYLNNFITDTLLINMWNASGNLNINVNADYIEFKSHTGTATISCTGQARELVAFMGGHGFIDTESTTCDKVFAVNLNTGILHVNALQFLNAEIAGSGNITYLGNPMIEFLDRGKGTLIKR